MTVPERQTILVVDDTEPVRKMVCATLSQAGYACLEACDGHDALRVLNTAAERVQLLLSDIRMPGMNGTELADHVSGQWPALPIVFMSGFTDESDAAAARTAAFIPKPFTAPVLIATVRGALATPRADRAGER